MKRLGVIGVGKMGRPMVLNLLKAGFSVSVFDVQREAAESVVSSGAIAAESVAEVTRQADVILLSLPNIPVLEEVVAGNEGILSVPVTGKTIIDTTTATVAAAQKLAGRLSAAGAAFLDAPVTGGVAGAVKGKLAFFVGGDKAVFEQQQEIFNAMGTATWIGESGHGQAGKMICQMVGSAAICMAVEAAGFAMHLGVDMEKVDATLGWGGPGPLHRVIRAMKSGDYNNEGYLNQRSKDIDYCMEEAARTHTFLPMTAAMQQMFNIARMKGYGHMGNEAMIQLYEEWTGQGKNED